MERHKRHVQAWHFARNVYNHIVHDTFSQPPVIIGGCGRSGTTLLTSALSAHPNIYTIPQETGLLCPRAYRSIPDLTADLEISKLYKHLYSQDIPRSVRRWCEKTPKNVHYFGKILDHFGKDVRLIHLVRDGRDVITSIHPVAPNKYWITPERWVNDVLAGIDFLGHDEVLTVKYEDLIYDFERELNKIGDFVGESMQDVSKSWVANARMNDRWHTIEPVHDRSIGRWQNPQFTDIIAHLLSLPNATECLKVFGYI